MDFFRLTRVGGALAPKRPWLGAVEGHGPYLFSIRREAFGPC